MGCCLAAGAGGGAATMMSAVEVQLKAGFEPAALEHSILYSLGQFSPGGGEGLSAGPGCAPRRPPS